MSKNARTVNVLKRARAGGPAPYARDPRGSAGQAASMPETPVEIDFNDPDCKKCDFKTRANDIQAAMLRHYAGHERG